MTMLTDEKLSKAMNIRHLRAFAKIPFVRQGSYGCVPSEWASRRDIIPPGRPALATRKLTRSDVIEACRHPNPALHGYVTAMAWGGQGSGLGGSTNAKLAWKMGRARLRKHLQTIREGEVTRREAYELFLLEPVAGLGPSYITKLIYFFMPQRGRGRLGYIMDQWTAKSVNLLTGQHIVRVYDEAPLPSNTGANYEAFCTLIDHMATQFKMTGEQLEERLFSSGARGQTRGPWRNHVLTHWNGDRPRTRYDEDEMLRWLESLQA